MGDILRLEQPITNLIKGARNCMLKWGSKELNDDVSDYNVISEYSSDKDYKIMHLLNDLCKNTVVCSMAIGALIDFVYMDYEKAVEKGDKEFKYVCWIRYHKVMRLAEEMDLGTGAFGREHATFDNISNYTCRGIQSLFLINYKHNLKDKDLDKLEDTCDTFSIPEERKEEIKKICGDVFDIQIDTHERYDEHYKPRV